MSPRVTLGVATYERDGRGFLLMREEGAWEVRVARNFDHEAIKGGEHKISHGIAEQVATAGETVTAYDAHGLWAEPRLTI